MVLKSIAMFFAFIARTLWACFKFVAINMHSIYMFMYFGYGFYLFQAKKLDVYYLFLGMLFIVMYFDEKLK